MRYIFLLAVALIILMSCTSDDDGNNRNPFLIDVNFSTQLSTIESLDLDIPSNPIYSSNGGLRGFFVINTGSGLLAWEASDPNHSPNECSTMVINGINVTCQCDDAHEYNLFTGQAVGEVLEYAMLNYRVTNNGGAITVSN